MIALQQRSPQGLPLDPHFFNPGDTQADRRGRRISHLIHRATGLQIPGTPLPIHPYPCQDPTSHPDRTGTTRRPEGLNELIRSTSFVLTIYTVPYPQGHSGLQILGNPLMSSPFLFDKEDLSPVHNLMHQSLSDNLLKIHAAARTTFPFTTAQIVHQMDTVPNPPLEPRRLWASKQCGGDVLLKWQNVVLIQHGQDTGFTQAPPRTGVESAGSSNPEVYKGHVMHVMIAILPTESIGHMIQKALALCYPSGAIVPSHDTLHYTLREYPSHLVWTQGRRPFYDTHINVLTNRQISLSHDDRLECITLETATIYAFLPPPDTAFALPPLSEEDMPEVQQPEHADLPLRTKYSYGFQTRGPTK